MKYTLTNYKKKGRIFQRGGSVVNVSGPMMRIDPNKPAPLIMSTAPQHAEAKAAGDAKAGKPLKFPEIKVSGPRQYRESQSKRLLKKQQDIIDYAIAGGDPSAKISEFTVDMFNTSKLGEDIIKSNETIQGQSNHDVYLHNENELVVMNNEGNVGYLPYNKKMPKGYRKVKAGTILSKLTNGTASYAEASKLLNILNASAKVADRDAIIKDINLENPNGDDNETKLYTQSGFNNLNVINGVFVGDNITKLFDDKLFKGNTNFKRVFRALNNRWDNGMLNAKGFYKGQVYGDEGEGVEDFLITNIAADKGNHFKSSKIKKYAAILSVKEKDRTDAQKEELKTFQEQGGFTELFEEEFGEKAKAYENQVIERQAKALFMQDGLNKLYNSKFSVVTRKKAKKGDPDEEVVIANNKRYKAIERDTSDEVSVLRLMTDGDLKIEKVAEILKDVNSTNAAVKKGMILALIPDQAYKTSLQHLYDDANDKVKFLKSLPTMNLVYKNNLVQYADNSNLIEFKNVGDESELKKIAATNSGYSSALQGAVDNGDLGKVYYTGEYTIWRDHYVKSTGTPLSFDEMVNLWDVGNSNINANIDSSDSTTIIGGGESYWEKYFVTQKVGDKITGLGATMLQYVGAAKAAGYSKEAIAKTLTEQLFQCDSKLKAIGSGAKGRALELIKLLDRSSIGESWGKKFSNIAKADVIEVSAARRFEKEDFKKFIPTGASAIAYKSKSGFMPTIIGSDNQELQQAVSNNQSSSNITADDLVALVEGKGNFGKKEGKSINIGIGADNMASDYNVDKHPFVTDKIKYVLSDDYQLKESGTNKATNAKARMNQSAMRDIVNNKNDKFKDVIYQDFISTRDCNYLSHK